MGLNEDINEMAKGFTPTKPEVPAPRVSDSELRREAQELSQHTAAVDTLCQQFRVWAIRNQIQTNWQRPFHRGWILAEESGLTGMDDNWMPTYSGLVVTTKGKYYSPLRSKTIRSDPGRWSIEAISSRIAKYVGESGKSWP